MKKKLIAFLSLCLFFSILTMTAFAQGAKIEPTKTFKGVVLNAKDNSPLENVTIKIVNAKKGAITKQDGTFSIQVKGNEKVEFSRVDMISQIIQLKETSNIILLQEAENNLNDVLVIAYGNQKRKSFTGAVGTIKNTTIEGAPNSSVQETLQGNVAGVQSTNATGQAGGVPQIRIRGIGSINASATPLYIIDGIPVVSGDISGLNSNTIAGLNANDIQTLTILKDASATSLYGSRAANGVILITN
jgi:TonB-dependent SusC/RagA subfamily outer membrane receptor